MTSKDQYNYKSKTKKRNEKGHSVTVVAEDPIVKIVNGQELSTKDDLFFERSFPGTRTDEMEQYINPTLKKCWK